MWVCGDGMEERRGREKVICLCECVIIQGCVRYSDPRLDRGYVVYRWMLDETRRGIVL